MFVDSKSERIRRASRAVTRTQTTRIFSIGAQTAIVSVIEFDFCRRISAANLLVHKLSETNVGNARRIVAHQVNVRIENERIDCLAVFA